MIDKTAPPGAELPVTSLNTVLTDPSVAMTTTTDYVGNMIYENGILKRILTPVGYWQDGTYYYFLKDHLGSNRIVMTGSGGIAETSSYYPSGMRFGESAVIFNNSIQPYRHTGHEMQEMHGLNWIDNLARFRTVSDGSGFTGVDPLAEKHYSISPYVYCSGNPVNRIDPDGKIDYRISKDGHFMQINPLLDKVKKILHIADKNDRILMEGSNKVISKLPAGSIGKISKDDNKITKFEIKNSAVAERVFKDVSRNTTVEWARVEHSTGNSKSNTLVNNHLNGSVDGAKVAIDYKNSGIGSNSCGPELLEQYRLDDKEISYEFSIVPSR